MAANEIHVGDVGTVFSLNIYQDGELADLSPAIDLKFIFLKPDGVCIERTASIGANNHIMTYTSIAGDLDVAGSWKMQGKVTFAASSFSTDAQKFKVYDNICTPA